MKNDFCVNTLEYGSVWGNLIDWVKANKIAHDTNDKFNTSPDKCVRYEGNILDYNNKVYAWFKNYSNGDNLFVEI